MIKVGIVVYDLYQFARDAALSAINVSSIKPDEVIIVDNSNGKGYDFFSDIPVTYVPRDNGGWPGGQNYLLETADPDDLIIISNDDIVFYTDTIRELINSINNPNWLVVYGKDAWSLYLTRRRLFEEIGPFDMAFHPCYFDDNDMFYRMKLQGKEPIYNPSIDYYHHGSATIKQTPKAYMEHHPRFQKNMRYYQSKWGGMPGRERYTTAFNK